MMSSPSHPGKDLLSPHPAHAGKAALVAVILVLATVAAYWGIWHNEFIFFDDPHFITRNPHVTTGLSYENIKWAFTELYRDHWHPLTWLSLMLDWQLFGTWAGGHHLVSLALHILGAIVLFLFLRYATSRLWLSALVASLFALHPTHVESVAWAAERKDVLSGLFWFATLWAYAYYARNSSLQRYLLVLLLFSLALLSKSMVVTLPLVCVLLDYWPLRRFHMYGARPIAADGLTLRKLILEKAPLLMMASGAIVLTIIGQSRTAAIGLDKLSLASRIANAITSYWWYIAKMFWPTNLSVYYFFSREPQWGQVSLLAVLLLTVTIAAALSRSRRYLIVGWLWYLLTLLPVIGIVQVGTQSHADRYTYIPFTGLFIILAWASRDIVVSRPRFKPAAAAVVIALLAVCGVMTHQTAAYWKDSITLFTRAVDISPDNRYMHASLGAALSNIGCMDEAEAALRKSLTISEGKYALCAMAQVLLATERPEEALVHARKALAMDPRYRDGSFYAGLACFRLKRYPEAARYLEKVLEADPESSEALSAMGNLMSRMGRFDEAIGFYNKAVTLDPGMPAVWSDLGLSLLRLHRTDEAIASFNEAIRLGPKMANAYAGLGMAFHEKGGFDKAVAACRKAIELDPKLADAYRTMAFAMATKGDLAGAIESYRKSLAIEDDFVAWNNLGDTYERLENLTEAESCYRRALAMDANNAVVHFNLGSVLSKTGRNEEALLELRQSLAIDPNYEDAKALYRKLADGESH